MPYRQAGEDPEAQLHELDALEVQKLADTLRRGERRARLLSAAIALLVMGAVLGVSLGLTSLANLGSADRPRDSASACHPVYTITIESDGRRTRSVALVCDAGP